MTPAPQQFSVDAASRAWIDEAKRTPILARPALLSGLIALLINALLVASMVVEFTFDPPAIPQAEEIPVEVVQEPPQQQPPPPAPSEEQQKPQDQPKPPDMRMATLDEAPAHDAPRQSTKAEPPIPEAREKTNSAPQQSEAAAKQPPASQQPPDKPPDERPNAEIAEILPPPKPPEPKLPNMATLGGAYLQQPEYQIAASNTSAPIMTGGADTRYLTMVYAQILPHMAEMQAASRARSSTRGAIDFIVSEQGKLIWSAVAEASGDSALDAAALRAVAQAAPFPPPRTPGALRLNFVYNTDMASQGQPAR